MKSIFSRFKSGPSDSRTSSRANSAASATSISAKDNKENHAGHSVILEKKSFNQPLKKVFSKTHLVETPKASPVTTTLTASQISPPPPPPRTLTPIANQHIASSSSPNLTYQDPRPHSVHGPISSSTSHLSPVVGLWEENVSSPCRNRTVSASDNYHEKGNGAPGKKVTFRSPAPTPTTSVLLDEAKNSGDADQDERGRGSSRLNGTRQSSLSPSKRASTSALKPPPSSLSQTQLTISRPGTSQSTNSTRPRPVSRQTSPFLPSLALRPQAFRKASLPPPPPPLTHNSSRSTSTSPTKTSTLLSPTPSDTSAGAMSNMSYLPQPNSWSEMAEDDLIANLGPKERTRQEVLWEIVSSEERYVQDLVKFNETFCKNLLSVTANSPHLDLYDNTASLNRAMSPSSPALSGNESYVNLPIASKFSSTPRHSGERYPSDSSTSTAPPMTPNEDTISRGALGPPPSSAARMNAYNILTNGRPTHKASFSSLNGKRSHTSLPPPAVSRQGSNSSQPNLHPLDNNNRLSYNPGFSGIHNKLHKANSRVSSGGSITSSTVEKSIKLPEDLEKVLTVLSGGILDGHIKLAAALKRRYENQYPLVRSLADVFTAHSSILKEYLTYVLHLEKALAQVDESLKLYNEISLNSTSSKHHNKRNSKKMEESELGQLSKKLYSLENLASEKGEAGLIISLSKPFQRLLKYPLLFQNLLFNTDPSLKEYEATLSMVDQVEGIVRQIEDEKENEETREKTRDVWARIDGLEKDKVIMAPKSSRVLISETQLPVPSNVNLRVQRENPAAIKGKKSFKRLSDILKGGGDSDLWVLRFSDVSLLCEKTGITHLPIASFKKATKSDSSNDLSKKNGTMGKRSASIRARNLYRFVKVHEWHLKSRNGSTDALTNMSDISTSRHRYSNLPQSPPASRYPTLPSIAGTTHATPTKVPMKTVDGNPSPSKSFRSPRKGGNGFDDDDTMSVVSEGISEMSFAFKDGDQLKPNLKVKPKARQSLPPSRVTSSSLGARSGSNTLGKARTYSQPGLARRLSGGHVTGRAADAKFAHRLRSPDANTASDTEEPGGMRSTSAMKVRRSLPPTSAAATTLSGGLRPLHTANMATTSSFQNRPAWNSGLSTTATARRASTPSSQIGSIRSNARISNTSNNNTNNGSIIRGTSESEGRTIPIGRSSLIGKSQTALAQNLNEANLASLEKSNDDDYDNTKDANAEIGDGEIRKMPSKEDSVVGLWKVYNESKSIGLGLGFDTPDSRKTQSSERASAINARTADLPSRGSVASLRGAKANGIALRGSPAVRGGASARGASTKDTATSTSSVLTKTAVSTLVAPKKEKNTATPSTGRGAGKAATVGRGGNLVSSRKRNLGGKI
ncbi:uncharacterized protein L201_002966 [Kwoniella dendrophila CBS 6074]|uniref:DH domain-containing protein n=1 Tax=Kwoniella dendrophila CBS 6074 TaxID=1295534 RepID=A0AAX4JU88_9TREE